MGGTSTPEIRETLDNCFTDQKTKTKTKTKTTTNIVYFSIHAYDRNPIKAFATL